MDPKNAVIPVDDEEDTLRESLEAAMDEHEPEKPSGDEATAVAVDPPVEVEDPALGEDPPTPVAEKPVEVPAAPAPEVKPTEAPTPTEPADPVAKAPGTWTPGAREKWVTLPAEVKAEVWKREKEASRALTISADSRRFAQEFSQTMQPYLGFIAAEKSTPLQAVNYMMQTGAMLRVGTPQQKVQVVAEVIKNYGIDLAALDQVLAGQQPQFNPQQTIQSEIQRALAPVLQQVQQSQQSRQQELDQAVSNEIDQFAADPKHEFYADVKEVMADIIELSDKRGQQMGLTEAYERAILIHEPVRRVIEARKQAEVARSATQVARRARGAAVSVTPSAEVQNAVNVPGDSVRSAIEFAMTKTEGR